MDFQGLPRQCFSSTTNCPASRASALHDYFAERKAALGTWTALLLEIARGERKVAPMRSRRSNS
jgi:hypothetical protein